MVEASPFQPKREKYLTSPTFEKRNPGVFKQFKYSGELKKN
jgi:hypothetical protein